MKQIYKTNAEFLAEAKKLNDQYKKEHKGDSMFSKNFEELLNHLFTGEFKDMPDHLKNAELNQILKPMKEN